MCKWSIHNSWGWILVTSPAADFTNSGVFFSKFVEIVGCFFPHPKNHGITGGLEIPEPCVIQSQTRLFWRVQSFLGHRFTPTFDWSCCQKEWNRPTKVERSPVSFYKTRGILAICLSKRQLFCVFPNGMGEKSQKNTHKKSPSCSPIRICAGSRTASIQTKSSNHVADWMPIDE